MSEKSGEEADKREFIELIRIDKRGELYFLGEARKNDTSPVAVLPELQRWNLLDKFPFPSPDNKKE